MHRNSSHPVHSTVHTVLRRVRTQNTARRLLGGKVSRYETSQPDRHKQETTLFPATPRPPITAFLSWGNWKPAASLQAVESLHPCPRPGPNLQPLKMFLLQYGKVLQRSTRTECGQGPPAIDARPQLGSLMRCHWRWARGFVSCATPRAWSLVASTGRIPSGPFLAHHPLCFLAPTPLVPSPRQTTTSMFTSLPILHPPLPSTLLLHSPTVRWGTVCAGTSPTCCCWRCCCCGLPLPLLVGLLLVLPLPGRTEQPASEE